MHGMARQPRQQRAAGAHAHCGRERCALRLCFVAARRERVQLSDPRLSAGKRSTRSQGPWPRPLPESMQAGMAPCRRPPTLRRRSSALSSRLRRASRRRRQWKSAWKRERRAQQKRPTWKASRRRPRLAASLLCSAAAGREDGRAEEPACACVW